MEPLIANLLDLLYELQGRNVPITVGGGFGLYLKRQHLGSTGQRTLFDQLPAPRATNDLDLFLRAEVIADLDRTREVAEAIRRLGYTVVEDAKFYHWKREVAVGSARQEVRIDVLVGPLGEFQNRVHIRPRLVRPKGSIEFHASPVDEAMHIEDEPIGVHVAGRRSTGEPHAATVYIPHAFPYLMMKLHAFDDRKDDADKDLGRHHALDLYTIVGMMTEKEYERVKELGAAYAADPRVKRARAIVRDHLAGSTALGILRLREHTLFRQELLLEEFMSVLAEIFSGG
jgi:predicted nucleotidyltransferase